MVNKNIVILAAVLLGAVLLVSGCCGSSNTNVPILSYTPIITASPSPSVAPGISSFFNANSFEYLYSSAMRNSRDGTWASDFTSTRSYQYADITLPDGQPGYMMTVTETFQGGNSGQKLVGNFTKNGTCKNATIWSIMNGKVDPQGRNFTQSASQFDLKNNPQIKFSGATKNLTTNVNVPHGSYDAMLYNTAIGGAIYMANNVPVPVKVEITSPCGSVRETYDLNKFTV